MKGNTKESRREYTWFITGEPQDEEQVHGVAIIVHNSLLKFIHSVIPLNDRIMVLQLRLTKGILFSIINIYAPHSARSDEIKGKFYKQLSACYKRFKNKGPTMVMGDFNARPGKPLTADERTVIGNHTLFPHYDPSAESEGVRANRDLLLQFCLKFDLQILNTFFDKPQDKLYTNRKFGIMPDKPILHTTHYQIDHCLLEKRWRRGIRNVEANPLVGIRTWHSSVEVELQFILKANYFRKPTKKYKLLECNAPQRINFKIHFLEHLNRDSVGSWGLIAFHFFDCAY